MMKAAYITSRPPIGHLTDHLQLDDTTILAPTAGDLQQSHQVLIQVKSVAICVDDMHVAEGSMLGGIRVAQGAVPTNDKPNIPGSAFSGVVKAVSKNNAKNSHALFQPGDRVCGFATQPIQHEAGPWAHLVIGNTNNLLPLPDDVTFNQGAAMVMPFLVAGDMMDLARPVLSDNTDNKKRVMVLGASGGIGSVLVQALRARFGETLDVVGVCSAKSRDFVLEQGANSIVDYNAGPIHETVLLSNNGDAKFDVVLDCVGGTDYYNSATQILKHKTGTFITCTGPEQWVGDRMFTTAQAWRYFWQTYVVSPIRNKLPGKHPYYFFAGPLTFGPGARTMIEQKIQPGIEQVIPFEEKALKEAIRQVASHRAKGKIVVDMNL